MFDEWQKERLVECLNSNLDIVNASEVQIKKINDLVFFVEGSQLVDGVDRILDTLDPNNRTDPLVKLAASLCLQVLTEEHSISN